MKVREPYFALQGWYPASEDACRQAVEEYLASFPGHPQGTHAGIVPHAGWVFSGRLAALVFAALRGKQPELVFVFGGHMHPGECPVCMTTGAWGTPLGSVAVEESVAKGLAAEFDCEIESPDRFHPDNTIELQMPFVRAVWPEAKVVAVQVPPGPQAETIGAWAARRSKDLSAPAVAIGSTDLTHYGTNYGFTPQGLGEEAHRWSKEQNDRPFLDRILGMDAEGAVQHALAHHSACCSGAAAAAVAFALECGAEKGQLLEHTTSHEVQGGGSASMWVGYASIVF
jgi:MEMO1 family protein